MVVMVGGMDMMVVVRGGCRRCAVWKGYTEFIDGGLGLDDGDVRVWGMRVIVNVMVMAKKKKGVSTQNAER